jgi:hypothetical protein
MMVASGVSVLTFFLMVFFYLVALQIWTLFNILQKPTVSLTVSVLVTAYVICVDIYSLFSPRIYGVKLVSNATPTI